MTRNKALIAGALALAAFAAVTYASPHWQLYRIRAAVEAGDAQALAARVDFPALRESVKLQVLGQLGAGREPGQADDNPFAAFGQAMARVVIDPVVDAAVSPAGVAAMLEAGDMRLRIGNGDGAGKQELPAPAPANAPAREKVNFALAYRSWDSVVVRKEDGRGASFILRRHRLWGWKLTGIELPRG